MNNKQSFSANKQSFSANKQSFSANKQSFSANKQSFSTNKQSFSANNPIGFFDSGVGLISVLIETKKLLPKENFVIFADQKHNPFGQKSKKQVKKYMLQATKFLMEKHNIKMMVIACNTASVLGLDYLRKQFHIPVIGVVPSVKTAYEFTETKKIVVMSTPATTRSPYLEDLVKKFGKGIKTFKLGCGGLEEAIEILDEKEIEKVLDKYIKRIKKFNPDIVVLGCTHYPLIRSEIQKKLGKIKIIDSGPAIAKRIKEVLGNSNQLSSKRESDIYYTTGKPQVFSQIVSVFLNQQIEAKKVY